MITRDDLKAIRRRLRPLRDKKIEYKGRVAHSFVVPFATYSPWLDDADFATASESVGKHTLLDTYRRFELWSLAQQLMKIAGDVLEVGVWRGGSGCLMALAAQGLDRSRTVFLCDTFAGVVKAGAEDTAYKGGEHVDTSEAIVAELAQSLGLHNVAILPGIFPDQTGGRIAERRFCLCHIDVDVYNSAKDVFDWVWPRLSPGGVVVFDDFGFLATPGVTKLVEELQILPDAVVIRNLNGHGLVMKIGT